MWLTLAHCSKNPLQHLPMAPFPDKHQRHQFCCYHPKAAAKAQISRFALTNVSMWEYVAQVEHQEHIQYLASRSAFDLLKNRKAFLLPIFLGRFGGDCACTVTNKMRQNSRTIIELAYLNFNALLLRYFDTHCLQIPSNNKSNVVFEINGSQILHFACKFLVCICFFV